MGCYYGNRAELRESTYIRVDSAFIRKFCGGWGMFILAPLRQEVHALQVYSGKHNSLPRKVPFPQIMSHYRGGGQGTGLNESGPLFLGPKN